MELRHLRCFMVLGEELHFTRAAERLHIEQSPLSRIIKELENELGVLLFTRDRRGTRLTQAGTVFLQDVRRVFTALEQACKNARAVSAGYRGSLRIAVSDGAVDPRLSTFLARCREEEPEVELRLSEVPLAEQLRGLRSGDFDIGFAHTADVGDGIASEPLWRDPLVVAVPARHPLLIYKEVPLHELASHSLIMCNQHLCEGYSRELTRLLRPLDRELHIAERVASLDMMLTLVAAGYGIGFMTTTRVGICRHPDVVIRPLAIDSALLTTYLLRVISNSSAIPLDRFTARLREQVND
ncbi:LysR substrate-binding domain-containing protein [Stenotrophomonas sp. NLF4-10]|uniref:LysR family transcriptional regulator n=1 Tax=Stenotrophomonas sp. NLF4-10 TaxID=2918754 RepID=UPI001EFBEB1E|nr:LysR substrate-binding domain-containing protein [Stenotrophomonas sp. NLF4-10]MCG8277495.1 LysR substrate-binding domain-containing protein [Stenotrophomonas sp. NLF4-10]